MSSTKHELDEIERAAQGGLSAPPQAPSQEDEDMRRGSSLFASGGGGPMYEVPPSTGGGGGDLLVDFPGSKSGGGYEDNDDLAPLKKSGSPANMSGPGRGAPSQGNRKNNAGYAQPPPGSFTGGRVPVGSGSSAMVNPTYISAAAAPLGPPPSNSEGTGDIRRNSVVLNSVAMAGLGGLIDFDDSDYEDSDDDGGRPGGPPGLPPGGPMPGHGSRPSGSNPAATGGPDHRPMVGGFAAAAYEAARAYHYNAQGKQVRTSQVGSRPRGRPNPPAYP